VIEIALRNGMDSLVFEEACEAKPDISGDWIYLDDAEGRRVATVNASEVLCIRYPAEELAPA
jgi:hypothetical protein